MKTNKTKLPPEGWPSVTEAYRRQYGLSPLVTRMDGRMLRYAPGHPANLPPLLKARAYAIQESIRWGEPHTSFIAPNVVCWVVPLENNGEFMGALVGGEVLVDRDPFSRIEAVNHLVAHGCARTAAVRYVEALPVWEDQSRTREAAERLLAWVYEHTGWQPEQLRRQHRRQQQQRQIAEELHQLKQGLHAAAPVDAERRLLSMMKAGDLRAARGELNRALAVMFSQTANIPLLRAQLIEMLGYLVRVAVEDNNALSALLETNHAWMRRLIVAEDFETVSRTAQEALDDYINKIALPGHSRVSAMISRVLTWLADHYHEEVTLERLAREFGRSPYRIAHLLKQATGKTMSQHVQQLRVLEAQRLLERSDLTCADVAYEAGFSDQSYFTKIFRRWMGVAPQRYRRLRQGS